MSQRDCICIISNPTWIIFIVANKQNYLEKVLRRNTVYRAGADIQRSEKVEVRKALQRKLGASS